MTDFIAEGYQVVTPYLTVNNAAEAIKFYVKAFGAKEVMRFEEGGTFVHGEIAIGDCRIMIGEEMPQWGNKSPLTLGGSPAGLHIYVKDVDQAFAHAVKAGAKEEHAPTNMFYGDRSGSVIDPFGHRWTLATHKEDLNPEQLRQRFREFMASMKNVPPQSTRTPEHAGR
jgi:PhnB protein